MSLVARSGGIEDEFTFTGGVARNIGMVRALEAKLGTPLNRSPESHFTGALGAALFALDRVLTEVQPVAAAALETAGWVDE